MALWAWLQGGGFLDGRAHNHGRVDASFFTPLHAVLYMGFLAVASWLAGTLIHHWAKGAAWQHVLPPAMPLSFLGVLVFAMGGMGDLVWHSLFGVEQSTEALYSPTHLTLAVGSALIRMRVVSSASARRTAGRMVVRRRASLDLPTPGGRVASCR